jgi:hypothetical protein
MNDERAVQEAAIAIAEAIAKRDVEALARALAPGFRHRTPSEGPQDAEAFLAAIEQIPGEILFVRLDSLAIDLADNAALATGIQHAQVRIEGQTIDDRRAFVDWFVKLDGEWRIRLAVDLPSPQ